MNSEIGGHQKSMILSQMMSKHQTMSFAEVNLSSLLEKVVFTLYHFARFLR